MTAKTCKHAGKARKDCIFAEILTQLLSHMQACLCPVQLRRHPWGFLLGVTLVLGISDGRSCGRKLHYPKE